MNGINIREALNECEPLFIKPKRADKHAAASRLEATEKMFEDWHAAINRTNTRGLPDELIGLYDEAAVALCKILTYERRIVMERR